MTCLDLFAFKTREIFNSDAEPATKARRIQAVALVCVRADAELLNIDAATPEGFARRLTGERGSGRLFEPKTAMTAGQFAALITEQSTNNR